MMPDYPNVRDCAHGRQRGKCADCECEELRAEVREWQRLARVARAGRDEAERQADAFRAEVERLKDRAARDDDRRAVVERKVERLRGLLREARRCIEDLCAAHHHPRPWATYDRIEAALDAKGGTDE